MATPSTLVFDLVPPRRPGLDDVGGGAKTDDSEFLADPPTMVSGNDVNQWALLSVALGKVTPSAVAYVTYNTAAFSYSVIVLSSTVSAGTRSTLSVLWSSPGQVSVTWPAGTFPPSSIPPIAYSMGSFLGVTHPIVANTGSFSATGVNVSLYDLNGAHNINYDFVLILF